MAIYDKKRKKHFIYKIIFSKNFIIICFIVLGLSTIALGKEIVRKYKVNNEISALEAEINNLARENGDLLSLVQYLKTENFVEREARLKIGYQRPGENVVIVTGDSSRAAEQAVVEETEDGNFYKWFVYFFGPK
ncbi:MAG TPA: septum formation initiator family protein [Patescibacteria group bacterium]